MANRNRGVARASKPSAPAPRPNVPRLAAGGGGAVSFYQDTVSELGKVVWPTRQEVAKLTMVVVGTVLVIFVYIWVLDTIFTTLAKSLYGLR